METRHRGKSPGKFSTPKSGGRPSLNLERSLRALDQRGEAGLKAELERIYPDQGEKLELPHVTPLDRPPT